MNPTYRIISGQWKAKRISAPKHLEVRPTTDFAKEALFSILENTYTFSACDVLDLCAGIGSISLEFASRGCQNVQAIEMNVRHTAFINETAAKLDLALHLNVHRADVFDYLKKQRGRAQYDIIFADPPFDLEEKKYGELLSLILNNKFLKPNGMLVLEHQSRKKIEHPNLTSTRKYGNVSFSFFAPNAEEEMPDADEVRAD